MELTTSEISYIRHVSRLFVRELGHLEGKNGMTLTQCHILMELEKYGVLNVKKLSELLHVDISTMSRTVKRLIMVGWISMTTDRRDRRARLVALTESGKKKLQEVNSHTNESVKDILTGLTSTERTTVEKGLDIYVNALTKKRIMSEYNIRPIERMDNLYLAGVIRTVLTEYGANKPGFAYVDPETDRMFETYSQPNAAFFVAMRGEKVVGGAGFNQLKGAGQTVCELQKMYLLPEARGVGLGARMLELCLEKAKEMGYKMCYLETLTDMNKAQDLYLKFGFKPISQPMGDTGHHGCNYWMLKVLS